MKTTDPYKSVRIAQNSVNNIIESCEKRDGWLDCVKKAKQLYTGYIRIVQTNWATENFWPEEYWPEDSSRLNEVKTVIMKALTHFWQAEFFGAEKKDEEIIEIYESLLPAILKLTESRAFDIVNLE